MNSAAGNASTRQRAVAASAMANERSRIVEIERIDQPLVVFNGPGLLDAAVDAARQKL